MSENSIVLVVDDDAYGREVFDRTLTGQGYELSFAKNGAEAIAQAVALTPDIILLDVMMPDMDGFEVCKRLREHPHLAEVPIIMVTALDDQESRLTGIEAGADDFISKPFNRAELRAKVRTITRLNRYRRFLNERTRFEWVVEQANDGFLIINEQDEILYANPKARLYLAMQTGEQAPKFLALAKKQYLLEPQENWSGWPSPQAETAGRERYLVRPETPTSNVNWLQVNVLDQPSSTEKHKLVLMRDVTANMTSQRDMTSFHRMLNHKLRTPLNAMQVSLEVLADTSIDFSSSEKAELAQMALQGIKRLSGEITDILRYLETPNQSRSAMGFMLLQLPGMVAQICKDLGIKSCKVNVDRKIEELQLNLSDKAVESVLWELLENSLKFHPSRSPNVEVKAVVKSDKMVQLQVADDGIHLSPDQLTHAWIPYYQGEKYFTGEVHGMGLGLAQVAAIVWQVGGECLLHNSEQRPGVVVELNIPLRK